MNKIIAIDFDGCLCKNKWPDIGEPILSTIEYAKYRQEHGDRLILWTCRVGKELDNAVTWCLEHGLIFDAVNENLQDIIEKFGGDCRKIFANEYWDDRSIRMGEPTKLIEPKDLDELRTIKWKEKNGTIYDHVHRVETADGYSFKTTRGYNSHGSVIISVNIAELDRFSDDFMDAFLKSDDNEILLMHRKINFVASGARGGYEQKRRLRCSAKKLGYTGKLEYRLVRLGRKTSDEAIYIRKVRTGGANEK